MNNRPLLILVCAALLGLVVAGYFLIEIEREEVPAGWSKEAYLNPLLAASLFLEEMEMPVESRDQLTATQTLPSGGTVFISRVGQVLTEGQRDQLHSWLDRGGHLVLSIGHGEDDNPLLAQYDISVSDRDCGCDDEDAVHEEDDQHGEDVQHNTGDQYEELSKSGTDEDSEEKPLSEQLREMNRVIREEGGEELQDLFENLIEPDEVNDPDKLTRLHFEGIDDTLLVNFGTDLVLEHPNLYEPAAETADTIVSDDEEQEEYYVSPYEPQYYAGTEAGLHFMQIDVGEGMLTVMAGNPIWNNRYIKQQDHAFLLRLLSDEDAQTLLLYGLDSPGLPELIWRNAPQLVMSCALLLLVTLWHRGRRFGPVRPAPDSSRRSLREHLLSSGEYQWRHGQFRQLISPLQRGIHDRAGRVLLDYPRLTNTQKVEVLSRHTGVETETIGAALSDKLPESASAFSHRIQILKTIREQL